MKIEQVGTSYSKKAVTNEQKTISNKKPVQSQGKASQKEKDRQDIHNKNNDKSKLSL